MGAPPPADVVLLAGGQSSRMGQPKGLVVVRGRPWVQHQLEAIATAGFSHVVLVLGHDAEAYRNPLADLALPVEVAVNPDPARGPFSSLQQGLARVAPGRPAFVLPIDVPAPAEAVWQGLLAALVGGVEAAIPVHQGRGGHPVLLGPTVVQRLLASPPASRLDAELRALEALHRPAGLVAPLTRVRRVGFEDPRILLNLNAPEDWRKLEEGG